MKIVLVDDNIVPRLKLKKFILDADKLCEVIEGKNGLEGIDIIKKEKPDLVFLDLLMPGLDGNEVLKRLRSEGIETKVVILTSDIRDKTKEELLALGAWQFLNKPCTGEKVAEIIKTMMKSKK
ncbi:MAG: response regulator [bacterium]